MPGRPLNRHIGPIPPVAREVFKLINTFPGHDEEIARITGYGANTIRNWRTGRRAMSLQGLIDIAEVFGLGLALVPKNNR